MEAGDCVTYVGCNDDQVHWGSNDDPREVLAVGNGYTIDFVEEHTWHTKVGLVGFDGLKFNSVSFKEE